MNDIAGPAAPTTSRTWEVLCHLSSLIMFLGVPFGNILGPLIVWLLKRSESPAIDLHGRESLNFQISLTLYLLAFTAVTVALMFVLVGFLLIPALIVVACLGPVIDLVFVIIASVRASNGEPYRYPLTIRFI
jgi:uncharacterized Tic20 family protein